MYCCHFIVKVLCWPRVVYTLSTDQTAPLKGFCLEFPLFLGLMEIFPLHRMCGMSASITISILKFPPFLLFS